MKICLGLFTYLALQLPTTALAGSSSLFLRAHIAPTFKIEIDGNRARLISNVKDEVPRPQLKVEKKGNDYRLIVIYP
jgi:hypothetical protein